MKKKLLFTAYSLEVGGIENALINLLNNLDYNKYEITLVLEKKVGIFLDKLPKYIKIEEYKVSNFKITIIRKILNRMKLIMWILKNKNKYDFSCSFATYSIPGAHLAINGSKNSALWMHGNYYVLYDKDAIKMQKFLNSVCIDKFKYNVYVSNENMVDIMNHYPKIKSKGVVCNNLINYKQIMELSNEKIDYHKDKLTILNIGRQEQHQKRLTRIFDAIKKLKKEKYDFKLILVGDGPDCSYYKKYVIDNEIEDYVDFLGQKKNPYPYMKLSDAVVLSSAYEGYPVVFLESLVLNKPILSTKVSDWQQLDNINGIFVENDDTSIYYAIKKFLDEGFKIKNKFNAQNFNKDIMNKIEKIINNSIEVEHER